ncbi:hypothetical protein QYE76_058359 [Lolium multiflorum]|uniref:Uncharacterized protein n=1 Tax=Lolium multiflorum TaxID=4521 RepID=A0AAD8T6Y2_LOLMU|nr:hypothetical protein QYE76_058359 [Lolium multiflorum]
MIATRRDMSAMPRKSQESKTMRIGLGLSLLDTAGIRMSRLPTIGNCPNWDGDEVEVVHADDSAEISTGMNAWETTGQEPLSGINLDDCERIDVTKDGIAQERKNKGRADCSGTTSPTLLILAGLVVGIAAVGAASGEFLVAATPALGRSLFFLVIIIILAVRPSAEALRRRIPSGGGGIILLLFLFFLCFFFFLLLEEWRSSSLSLFSSPSMRNSRSSSPSVRGGIAPASDVRAESLRAVARRDQGQPQSWEPPGSTVLPVAARRWVSDRSTMGHGHLWRKNTREKRALRRAGIRRGNSSGGEIDAIVTVIELDFIGIIIIIISIDTAISTAAPRLLVTSRVES